MASIARFVVGLALLTACDERSHAAPAAAERRPAAPSVAKPVLDAHGDEHSGGASPPASAPTATSLAPEVRQKLSTLRISAHHGGIILRKGADGWSLSGMQHCAVPSSRVERALDNLAALRAVKSSDALGQFELQIVLLIGEERALYFDIGERRDGKDLIQLGDQSRFVVTGLDRELWSPDPTSWCGHQP